MAELKFIDKKKRIKVFLNHAKLELARYKRTKRNIHLSQASEKIWAGFVLLIELKSGKEIKTHKGIEMESYNLIKKNKLNRELSDNASLLHSYYYEGRIFSDTVVRKIIKSLRLFNKELKKV